MYISMYVCKQCVMYYTFAYVIARICLLPIYVNTHENRCFLAWDSC